MGLLDHFRRTKERARYIPSTNAVTGDGRTLGAPPAIGAGAVTGNAWAGGHGFEGVGVTPSIDAPDVATHIPIPPHRPPAQILPDIKVGTFSPSFATELWDGPDAPKIDRFVGRHTRTATDSYASLKQWGSFDVASTPEGTLTIFPPHLPRELATGRSVSGAKNANVLLNMPDDRVSTPDVPVVRN